MSNARTYRSTGGSSIDVVLQFNNNVNGDTNLSPFIYLGSAISVSYSIYRAKTPVYRLGDTTPNGFSIGKKTVAGSIIKAVMEEDEINEYLKELVKTGLFNTNNLIPLSESTFAKDTKNVMKDDLLDFNIILMFSSEYTSEYKTETIYGANIISNGQVMSAMDLFTETTMSFIAKDVKQIDDVYDYTDSKSNSTVTVHNRSRDPVETVSSVLFGNKK